MIHIIFMQNKFKNKFKNNLEIITQKNQDVYLIVLNYIAKK